MVSCMVVSSVDVSDKIVESELVSSVLSVLHAATDKETAIAKKPNFNKFFMIVFLSLVVMVNTRNAEK